MVKKNACIFISGQGSNLENLIKKIAPDLSYVSYVLLYVSDVLLLGLMTNLKIFLSTFSRLSVNFQL